MKKAFDELPVLENENIVLRPLSIEDKEALERFAADDRIYR